MKLLWEAAWLQWGSLRPNRSPPLERRDPREQRASGGPRALLGCGCPRRGRRPWTRRQHPRTLPWCVWGTVMAAGNQKLDHCELSWGCSGEQRVPCSLVGPPRGGAGVRKKAVQFQPQAKGPSKPRSHFPGPVGLGWCSTALGMEGPVPRALPAGSLCALSPHGRLWNAL